MEPSARLKDRVSRSFTRTHRALHQAEHLGGSLGARRVDAPHRFTDRPSTGGQQVRERHSDHAALPTTGPPSSRSRDSAGLRGLRPQAFERLQPHPRACPTRFPAQRRSEASSRCSRNEPAAASGQVRCGFTDQYRQEQARAFAAHARPRPVLREPVLTHEVVDQHLRSGRYWFRTSDLCRVKAALSR